jgi:hypothetical protein
MTPPDRDTPGARAAQRHSTGDAKARREVAKDALIEGASYADPDPAYVGHIPSSMSPTDVDEAWMKLLAVEAFQLQDVSEEEEEVPVYDGEEEYLDAGDGGFELEQGGTLMFDEGTLAAEADERAGHFED